MSQLLLPGIHPEILMSVQEKKYYWVKMYVETESEGGRASCYNLAAVDNMFNCREVDTFLLPYR